MCQAVKFWIKFIQHCMWVNWVICMGVTNIPIQHIRFMFIKFELKPSRSTWLWISYSASRSYGQRNKLLFYNLVIKPILTYTAVAVKFHRKRFEMTRNRIVRASWYILNEGIYFYECQMWWGSMPQWPKELCTENSRLSNAFFWSDDLILITTEVNKIKTRYKGVTYIQL